MYKNITLLVILLSLIGYNSFAQPGNALDFDGSNDRVTVNSVSTLDNLAEFSAEMWIYPTGYGSDNLSILMSKRDFGATGNQSWELYLEGADNSLIFYRNFNDNSSDWAHANSVPNAIVLNTWQHIALTLGADNIPHLFINGVEVEYSLNQAGVGTPNTSSCNLYIGANYANGRVLVGKMDEARVWNTARSQCDNKVI